MPQYALTENFTWAELLGPHSITDLPESIQANVALLAQRLQVVRDVLGVPVVITSGYRSLQHNARVGGHPDSYHVKGMAADIVVPGVPAVRVQHVLRNWSGGLGSYATFTHIDIGPRRRWKG